MKVTLFIVLIVWVAAISRFWKKDDYQNVMPDIKDIEGGIK